MFAYKNITKIKALTLHSVVRAFGFNFYLIRKFNLIYLIYKMFTVSLSLVCNKGKPNT